MTNDEEHRQKLVLMYQASMCGFQLKFSFGCKKKSDGRNAEDALGGYKYRQFNQLHVFYQKINQFHIFQNLVQSTCVAMTIIRN